MSRGNRKSSIFEDDHDRNRFLNIVGDACETHAVLCLAYCLMGNHYHLVLEPPRCNLSSMMHDVNGEYARYPQIEGMAALAISSGVPSSPYPSRTITIAYSREICGSESDRGWSCARRLQLGLEQPSCNSGTVSATPGFSISIGWK